MTPYTRRLIRMLGDLAAALAGGSAELAAAKAHVFVSEAQRVAGKTAMPGRKLAETHRVKAAKQAMALAEHLEGADPDVGAAVAGVIGLFPPAPTPPKSTSTTSTTKTKAAPVGAETEE